MEPRIEYTFYSWVIIMTVVGVAAAIGMAVDFVRERRHRALCRQSIERNTSGDCSPRKGV